MTEVGSVYGKALYELAREEALEEKILRQLSVLQQCFRQEPGFAQLLSAPNLPRQERCGILDDCFRDKVHPYLLNFLKILTEKGYIRHFCDCCDAYTALYNEDRGILVVTAVTAVPLSSTQEDKLTRKLNQLTGKEIALRCCVDSEVLGGIRLDYDGQRLDDTVSHRLDAIRELLNKTVL